MISGTKISLSEPVSLDRIADSGQCFRWVRTDDGYRVPHREKDLFVRQDDPCTLEMSCSEKEYETVWKGYFDLDARYDDICSRVSEERDPFLSAAIRDQSGIRILRQDPWEMLITSVIMQNRNIPAIRKSVELLCNLAGKACPSVCGGCFRAFPAPEQLARLNEEQLRDCRLGYRTEYVRLAAQAVASGELDLDELRALPDRECEDRVLSIKGIGKKVAACFLLFGLHRMDAFPIDVWMKRILENEYPCGYPMAEYSPYNGLFQQYMFAYYRGRES